jgi:hypothetical protein
MIVGLQGFRPYLISIGSDQHVGWSELLPVVAVGSAVLLFWLLVDLVRRRSAEGVAFPVYLIVIGAEAGVAYALTRDLSMFTFRYGLLVLYLPIGVAALLLQPWRPAAMRVAAAALVGLIAAASLVDHLVVLQHARDVPPRPRFVPLAERLEARGVRLARAGYWRAYVIAFLTEERVKVASTELQRIREYQVLTAQASDGVVTIQETPCDGQQTFEVVGVWHVCR